MSPPRRSTRVRTRIHEQTTRRFSEQNSKCIKPSARPHGGHDLNTKGLPTVPAELLLEILSYMQEMPIPFIQGGAISAQYKEKRTALYALCQTCRSLRSALLPFVWERIEVCATDEYSFNDRHDWCKNLATDFVKQLNIVTVRDPSLASFVKAVTVAICGYSANHVLRELAQCLTLMPNLQTIEIIDMLDYSIVQSRHVLQEVKFEKAFKSYTFPSITRVILPPRAHGLLHCFPNARRIYLNWIWWPHSHQNSYSVGYDACRKWLSKAAEHCRNVEEFGFSQELDQYFMDSVISTLPNLRSVQIHYSLINAEITRRLSELKNLEKIEILAPCWSQQFHEKREEVIRVLEKFRGGAKKKILVITRLGTSE